jgi:hypothetical protein
MKIGTQNGIEFFGKKSSIVIIRRHMPAKRLKICDKGHKFYQSSDCPTCPICAAENKPEMSFLSLLNGPAQGALEHAAISSLTKLPQNSERAILKLHGVGQKSLPTFKQALSDAGLAFAEPVKKK